MLMRLVISAATREFTSCILEGHLKHTFWISQDTVSADPDSSFPLKSPDGVVLGMMRKGESISVDLPTGKHSLIFGITPYSTTIEVESLSDSDGDVILHWTGRSWIVDNNRTAARTTVHTINLTTNRQLPFSVAAVVVIGIVLLLFIPRDTNGARRAVARIIKEGARPSLLGGPGLEGDLTNFELLGMSERGDCKKVHAYFRVGDSPELEGTFLYLDNGDDVAFRTFGAATFDRRGTALPGWYNGHINDAENRICGEMLSSSEKYSDGVYKIIK
jgi:hypothetical protein